MRRRLLTILLPAGLLWPAALDAQQIWCAPPAVCAEPAAINAAADALCRRARHAEVVLDEVSRELAVVTRERDEVRGELRRALAVSAPAVVSEPRAPLWLRIGLDVAIGGLAAAAALTDGELRAGLAGVGIATLLGRVVLEVVW